MTNLTPGESLTVWALGAFFALWVFALGANLGSFLNVVVYRLPRGMPLALSVSRCPKCANPIAPRDNIPIISWLLLRGRCRSCGQPISPRYPLVEATVGCLVLAIFAVELLSGGRNLPLRPPGKPGLLELLAATPWDLIGIAAAHACLLYLLLAVALIQSDRRVVPWKFVAVAVLIGIALMPFQLLTVEGGLSPALAAAADPRGIAPRPAIYAFRLASLFSAAAGLACGAAWGLLHARMGLPVGGRRRAAAVRAMPLSMALVGLFLGWQAATAVALASGVLRFAGAVGALVWPGVLRMPSTGCVFAATLIHLLTWRWQEALPLWPGSHTAPIVLACVCVAGAIAARQFVPGRLIGAAPG